MFLKSYARPYLGLTPPATKQVSTSTENGTPSGDTIDMQENGAFPASGDGDDADELVEKDMRDRFKKMCEVFDNVAKKLVIEHKVRFPVRTVMAGYR